MAGSGLPGYQPSAFQNNAFQTGIPMLAANYSIGSPTFATPALGEAYHLTSTGYSVGSPTFAAPAIKIIGYGLHGTPVTLGSPTFGLPSLRSDQHLAATGFSVGSPTFILAAVNQFIRLFANAYAVGSPTFAAPDFLHDYQLDPIGFSVGSPDFEPPHPPIIVDVILAADTFDLGSPAFNYPYLVQVVPPPVIALPPLYGDVVDETMTILNKILSLLLASIPDNTGIAAFNARLEIDTLRATQQIVIAAGTLGSSLQACYTDAAVAGATYQGLDVLRQYIMSEMTGTDGSYVQNMLRSALVMTLSAESVAIQALSFVSQSDAQAIMTNITGAFEAAKAVGIDDYDSGIYQTITALGGSIARYLAQEELQLPKMVTYRVGQPMPSLFVAQLIYQDATRADEISDENGVINPMFCPVELQVLSDFDA